MNFDDLPEIDLDLEDLPIVDLDAPQAPPRPKPKKKKVATPPATPVKPFTPTPPSNPPYGMQMKDVVPSIRETLMGTPEQRRTREVQKATQQYEAGFLQEPPPPHKFVPKTYTADQVNLLRTLQDTENYTQEREGFDQMLQDAERTQAINKIGAKYSGAIAPSKPVQLINRFMRGYTGSMESMVKGPTLFNPRARTDLTTKWLYMSPEQERARMQTLLPVDDYNNSFFMRASEAMGSSLPFMMSGAAGEAAGLPEWMMSALLGASSNAAQTYDEAIASGADEQSARYSSIYGAIIGLSEGLGVGRMGIPEIHTAAFATPLMQRLRQTAMEWGREGVEEWAQETAQQILNNANAKVASGYDPKRAIQEGVWDAGLMGFTTGVGMSAGMHGIMSSFNRMDPEYRAARQEYLQAQLVDKAFKQFMKGTNSGDLRQIGVIQGGKAPSAPQFQTGFLNAANVPALTDERAAQIAPRTPRPPGRRVPQLTTMIPMWDMAEMTKKPDGPPPAPLTEEERKRRYDLKETIEAYEKGEVWAKSTVQWMGGIDKVRTEFEELERRRMSDVDTTTVTPRGRRRLPSWSDEHVDSLTEENYQAHIERKDAFDQLQEAKGNFPKDAYGNTKVSPSMFHSLIIRVESIYENSSDPIGDVQKIAPNDPELTQSLLGYLFAYERMEHARIAFDEQMAGPGRRVFGQYDHPDVTPANMTDEEYELRYEENTLQERAKHAAYAFYPMLKPALGEYLGYHEDNLAKAYRGNPEARALIDKAIAEHPSLAPIWKGYVDAVSRLEKGDYRRKINDIRHATRPVPKTRTTTTAEEEYQGRERKELEELNKGITLDKLNKINERQNILMEGMLEAFKQRDGDKYNQLDSDNAIQDIISNSNNPLEDLKNLFPGNEKFARMAEKYLNNVREQNELFDQLRPENRPSIPKAKATNEPEEKEKKWQKLNKLGDDLDKQLWDTLPQEIKDMPDWQHAMIPGRAAYDHHLANHPNLLKQRMGVYEELVNVFAKPQDKELAKKLPGWEKEINQGGLKPLQPGEAYSVKEEQQTIDKMQVVRTTPGGRNVYGNWGFTDDQVDNMSQEEYDSREELNELHKLKLEIPHKLWPYFQKEGWNYSQMLDHLRGSDIHPDMVKVTQLRGITDPEALNLVSQYAYIVKRLPMISDETTERINQLINKRAEEEDAFTPERDVHADDRLLSEEEIDEIVGVGQDIPEGFTADDPEWVHEESEFFAPKPKGPNDTDYGIMYKSTGIEEWEETKRKAKEEEEGKDDWTNLIDPNLPEMSKKRDVNENTKSFNFITEAKKLAGKADPNLTRVLGEDYVWNNLTDYQQRKFIDEAVKRYKEMGGTLTYDPTGAMDNPAAFLMTDEMAFDVMPALRSGQAPYLRAPKWFLKAIGYGDAGGVNAHMDQFNDLIENLKISHAPAELADAAYEAMMELKFQSLSEGLNSLSIVDSNYPEHQVRGFIEHEVGHAAQKEWHIDPEWTLNHPTIRDVADRKLSDNETVRQYLFGDENLTSHQLYYRLGREMMTYWVEGRSNHVGMTESEGREYFKQYINHIRSIYGQEGVDNFVNIMRPNRRVLDAVNESNIEWAVWMTTSPILTPGPSFEVIQMPAEATRKPRFEKWASIVGKVKDALGFNVDVAREVLKENPPASRVDLDEEERPTDVPVPPEPPPRMSGGGVGMEEIQGPLGPLYKKIVNPDYSKLLTNTFKTMLEEGQAQNVNPLDPPFLQVLAALKDGQLRNVDIGEILSRNGIDWDVFADEMKETASLSGKALQQLSEIGKFWDLILDEYEVSLNPDDKGKSTGGKVGPRISSDNLTALLRMIPNQVKVRRAMRGVQRTILGKNFWQRAGNVTQKAMLTQLSTFGVNTMTTLGQLPIRLATQGMGAWMYHMVEDKGSFGQKFHNANEDMKWSLSACWEVLRAMNPTQVKQWLQHQGSSTKFAQYQAIVTQLEGSYPEIHRKLFAMSTGTETLKEGKRQLSLAQALLPGITDKDMRDQLGKDLKKYEMRLENNQRISRKLLNKTEMVYDFCLKPMQVAEYFFRRPMFVGQLTLELKRLGVNLSQVLAQNQFDQISPEIIEKAVNKALEFTYAYMPGTKTGTNYDLEHWVEKGAAHVIEGLNKYGGPFNALFGEPFGKAIFNGMKFAYEYSPVGAILPSNRIVSNLWNRQDVAQYNNQVRFGQKPTQHLNEAETYVDPLTGRAQLLNPTTHADYDRLAKSIIGTVMYVATAFMRHYYGGDEWWQIKRGKGPDGRPIYLDIRRYKPFSTMFQVVDLVDRLATGRIGDMNINSEIMDAIAGMRMYDNQMGGSIFEATADWWRHEEHQGLQNKAIEEVGQAMAVYFTPLINLRDCIAQFNKEENVKKDTRGSYNVFGPVMDKIPFLRRLLPNLTSPVEPFPIELSRNPGIAQTIGFGYKTMKGKNFAGREWDRLGLFTKSFITRDPDPLINRAQNEYFQNAVGELAEHFAEDPAYLNATDAQKKMMWEMFIGGDEGFAEAAKNMGGLANPTEIMKREMKAGSGMGRFTKEGTGYNEAVDKMFEEKK